jgi:hypothetical protein
MSIIGYWFGVKNMTSSIKEIIFTKYEFALVYVLVLPATNGFKVGKTLNLCWRFFDLRTQYGSYDLSNSFFIQVPRNLGIPYERLLKNALKQYKLKQFGREVFSIEGFNECLDLSIQLCKAREDLTLTHWEIENWINRQWDLRNKKLELSTVELKEKRKFLQRNKS